MESTRGAAAYLDQAYGYLGSWPLAITSYNYGQAGMARAVAEVGSSNLVDLIERYNHPYWGFPPKQFYAEFLAAVEIGKNFQQYFPGIEQDAPRKIQEVALAKNTSLGTAIRSTGLSQEEFMQWNPALSANIRVLPAGYRVKVPADRSVEPIVEVAQVNYQAPAAAPRRMASTRPQQQQTAEGSGHPSPRAARRDADPDRPAIWGFGSANSAGERNSQGAPGKSWDHLAHSNYLDLIRHHWVSLVTRPSQKTGSAWSHQAIAYWYLHTLSSRRHVDKLLHRRL